MILVNQDLIFGFNNTWKVREKTNKIISYKLMMLGRWIVEEERKTQFVFLF